MAQVPSLFSKLSDSTSDHYFNFQILSVTLIVFGTSVAVSLQFLTAPYGRYFRSGFGVNIPAKLAWFTQELPAFVIPLYLIIFTDSGRDLQWPIVILLCLYMLHYLHRVFIFSLSLRGGKPSSLSVFLFAIVFCILNGYLQCGYLLWYKEFGEDWSSNISFYIGIFLFVTGMCINIHSDHLLRNLRKPGETGYKIPRGGMFEFVSGANFLGEILEWTGFAIAGWNIPAAAYAYSTMCNLSPRACHHHRWYKEKFEDYPKHRKAVIPFIL